MNSVIDLLGPGIFLGIPVLYAALGGIFTHRAGFFNIALEGFMLLGAYFSIFGAMLTKSLLVGTLVGIAAALVAAAIMGVLVVYFGADDVIVGIAVNLAALGLTTYLLTTSAQSTQGSTLSQGYPLIHLDAIQGIPVISQLFNDRDLLTWLAIPVVIGVAWFVNRSRLGLQLNASGEAPLAARAAGIKVDRIRVASVLVSGLFCGIAGAELAVGSVHLFSENMTAGRGIIAFAAVIFGAGRVGRVVVACLIFGFAQALAALLQITTHFPSQVVLMLPYLLTIVAVVGSDILRRAKPGRRFVRFRRGVPAAVSTGKE
ncbi:ABC transporter permease [Leifsonia sp. NPDC056665]|uniref:ABC transporter permease n=1 Tax=Leifsonia sp. NPDC056665 TaxID=3345901 RepID=UPI0036D1C744